MSQSFSMRKIPITQKTQNEIEIENNTDKIKILELSNIIDAWEKEVLFSENGFYSLKGKAVENKTKEFIKELEKFINSQIAKLHFVDISSKELAIKIKDMKLNSINRQMQMYESEQLDFWMIEVYENGIQSCIQRALLYKDVPEIVTSSYKNGLSILQVMSEKEEWNSKIYKSKKENFTSDFYFQLINSFILDKDVKASLLIEKYQDKIKVEDKENLEKALEKLKNNVIAYNWAKELFSYDLSESENEKEIISIRDKEIEHLVREFFLVFKQTEKKEKENSKKEKNEENWKEILSILNIEPDKAELYIDYTLSKESQNAKKEYIKTFRKNGYIETDKKKFLDLLEEIQKDFDEFKQKDISDYRKYFSIEDFEIIEKFKSLSNQDYNFFVSDYKYVTSLLESASVTCSDEIYDFVKYILSAKDNFVAVNKKELDIEERNKLIKSALERYTTKQIKHN